MSQLPQRKKSAEELSQLRETLGIQKPQQTVAEVEAPPAAEPAPAPPVPVRKTKPIRSLRKSEQVPAKRPRSAPSHPASSKLPARRHTEEEIMRLRRQDANQTPPKNPKLARAHNALVGCGYLIALVGAYCFRDPFFPLAATAASEALAAMIAITIAFRYPISRHHAGFMAIIILLVSAFAILHYLPSLAHAP